MKTLGYLRVSTQDQNPDRQIDGLAEICDAHFVERASAASMKRPVFNDVLQKLQPGDTLVVWDLDRAFRSTIDAIQTADMLQQRGIALHIVNLQLDRMSRKICSCGCEEPAPAARCVLGRHDGGVVPADVKSQHRLQGVCW